jgi:hypothetical protein
MYISDTLQTPGVYLGLFADDRVLCMIRIAKRVMFSERGNAVSVQLRRGVSAGTFKTMTISFGLQKYELANGYKLTTTPRKQNNYI